MHAAGEEETLLRNDPELAAERFLGDVTEVCPVNCDAAGARIVEAHEQFGDGRFPGAGVADESDGCARGDVELQAVQHLGALPVAEANLLEVHMTGDFGERPGVRVVEDLGLLVQHVHDLVECGRGREKRVVELRELLHRVEEVGQIADEGKQRSHGQAAPRDEISSIAEHDRGGHGREEVDKREVEAAQQDRALVRFPVMVIDFSEACDARLLPRERLQDADPGDVLGERRRD